MALNGIAHILYLVYKIKRPSIIEQNYILLNEIWPLIYSLNFETNGEIYSLIPLNDLSLEKM